MKTVFLLLGCIIGAGFASGAEVYEYFAKFGWKSLVYIIPLFFCFFIMMKILLRFGSNTRRLNFKQQTNILCKNISIFKYKINYLNIFLFLTFLIISSAMFAGLVSLFLTYLPNASKLVIYIFLILLSVLLVNVPFLSLCKISYFLVPIIIICLCIVFCLGLNFNQIQPISYSSIIPLPSLTVLYATQNTFLSSFVIITSGKNLNKKQQTLVSLITSFVICFLITLGIICLLHNPGIANSNMPFARLACDISPYFSALFGIVIFFSIITTYASSISSLKEYFGGEKKHNNKTLMLFLVVLLSLFDFGNIIAFLYPIIGMFGAIFACLIFNINKKSRALNSPAN